MTHPPPGVGPALSALIERLHRFTPGGEWWDQMVEQPWGEWVRFKDVEAALSGSVGGLNAAPPEPLERQDDLGLSIDMLDVDRLRDWANLLLIHGPDISYWGSLHFVVSKMQIMATEMEKAIRDIGTLRALPASPVCAAEKKA